MGVNPSPSSRAQRRVATARAEPVRLFLHAGASASAKALELLSGELAHVPQQRMG